MESEIRRVAKAPYNLQAPQLASARVQVEDGDAGVLVAHISLTWKRRGPQIERWLWFHIGGCDGADVDEHARAKHTIRRQGAEPWNQTTVVRACTRELLVARCAAERYWVGWPRPLA